MRVKLNAQFMPTAVTGKAVGNDSNGMASRNQAIETLKISFSAIFRIRSSWLDLHVAGESKLALVEHSR